MTVVMRGRDFDSEVGDCHYEESYRQRLTVTMREGD